MKTKLHFSLFIFLLFVVTVKSYALDYTITFTASGLSSSIGVIVQNMTRGTSVNVPTGNTLLLTGTSSVDQLSVNEEGISISQNQVAGIATFSFFAKQAGNNQIEVFGINGKKVVGTTAYLSEGKHSFQLALTKGVYTIRVGGKGYLFSSKILFLTNLRTNKNISYIKEVNSNNEAIQKAKRFYITMAYTTGDRLMYKGTSGNYTTIVTDVPIGNKTINFNFVECKDGDANYYATVTIGTQVWMAENLKTTKYRDGSDIPNVTDAGLWASLTTGANCDHSNNPANSLIYGKLYNWFTVSDSRNIAPTGWHVPSDAEWTTLITYLGGDNVAGGKLKETGLTHWLNVNTGATNETGFTALPAGGRNMDGAFPADDLGLRTQWWSTSEYIIPQPAWYRGIPNNNIMVVHTFFNKVAGFSVRCIKD